MELLLCLSRFTLFFSEKRKEKKEESANPIVSADEYASIKLYNQSHKLYGSPSVNSH